MEDIKMVVQYRLRSGVVIDCEIDIENGVVWQLSLGNRIKDMTIYTYRNKCVFNVNGEVVSLDGYMFDTLGNCVDNIRAGKVGLDYFAYMVEKYKSNIGFEIPRKLTEYIDVKEVVKGTVHKDLSVWDSGILAIHRVDKGESWLKFIGKSDFKVTLIPDNNSLMEKIGTASFGIITLYNAIIMGAIKVVNVKSYRARTKYDKIIQVCKIGDTNGRPEFTPVRATMKMNEAHVIF